MQLAVMEVLRALLDRLINNKEAGLMLYGLQIASGNVGRVTFHQKPEEMVLEDEPLAASQSSALEDEIKIKQEDKGQLFEDVDHDLRARMIAINREVERRRIEKARIKAEIRGEKRIISLMAKRVTGDPIPGHARLEAELVPSP